jgi:Uma2 family endonuclease
MSTAAHKKPLTAEEFFLLPAPDGWQQELIHGKIIATPLPGGLHGVCCSKVGRRIGNFVEKHDRGTVTSNDTGLITERGPDSVRGPHIAYRARERLPVVPVGYIEIYLETNPREASGALCQRCPPGVGDRTGRPHVDDLPHPG